MDYDIFELGLVCHTILVSIKLNLFVKHFFYITINYQNKRKHIFEKIYLTNIFNHLPSDFIFKLKIFLTKKLEIKVLLNLLSKKKM